MSPPSVITPPIIPLTASDNGVLGLKLSDTKLESSLHRGLTGIAGDFGSNLIPEIADWGICEWSRSSMRSRPVLSNLSDTRPRNHIRERDRNESSPPVAVRESRVTRVQKDPRSNMNHAIVRSNRTGATTAPGWRRAAQPSPFVGESRGLQGSEARHPFQPPPSPKCCREVHELPSEGTRDA